MSFYVSLHGTKSPIDTELNSPIHLKSDYEVALTEISFNSNFFIDCGKIKIISKINNAYYYITSQITLVNNISIEKFVDRLNYIVYNDMNHYFTNIENTLNNKPYISKSFFYLHTNFVTKNAFFYLENNQIYINTANELNISIYEINGLIKRFFISDNFRRFKYPGDIKIEKKTKLTVKRPMSYVLPKQIQFLNNIFVHCNIVDSTSYGDKKLNILRIIPIKYKNNNIKVLLKKTVYVDVKDTIINSINIKLCDELQNEINCDNFFNQFLLTLHFKPKKQ